MADEVRETIRAAQAAELRGDLDGAIALLRQAAALYRSKGNRARAMQMLRQALRLDDARTDVAEELRRLEALSDGELYAEALRQQEEAQLAREQQELLSAQTLEALSLAAADETLDAAALERALEGAAALLPEEGDAGQLEQVLHSSAGLLPELDAAPRARAQRLVERGPSRAAPELAAWCSFCCRPAAEVGALVAGPAGAFICVGCARESTALLGAVPVPHAPPREPVPAPLPLVGQEAAQELLERALSQGARRILVLGPEGSGKSTWMRALVAAGRAVPGDPARLETPAPGNVLVLEDVDRLAAPAQEALAAWL
ncbi:MAG TPA: ClpX C4-type zinc finger protein, partial [Aggregicoccus sp.]|nr:ClpX C4-type zinc finger protein [Aggregicoccus sp.]